MKTSNTISDTRDTVRQARASGQSIGVVPTMGALHDGHVSLLKIAHENCDFVVGTIFVNPTQFAPGEDLDKYPRTLEADLEKCQQAGADLVFLPDVETMYPEGADTVVQVQKLAERLEGSHRPSHFQGVTTIVTKLLNITEPDFAFFGQKDFQQQMIIRRMCTDLDLPVEIVTCPIIRETDGLAMSSRNRFLSGPERKSALRLNEALAIGEVELRKGREDLSQIVNEMQQFLANDKLTNVDYIVLADPETLVLLEVPQDEVVALVAANVGTTRLIDNRLIRLNAGTKVRPNA